MNYDWRIKTKVLDDGKIEIILSQYNKKTDKLIIEYCSTANDVSEIGNVIDSVINKYDTEGVDWEKTVNITMNMSELATLIAFFSTINYDIRDSVNKSELRKNYNFETCCMYDIYTNFKEHFDEYIKWAINQEEIIMHYRWNMDIIDKDDEFIVLVFQYNKDTGDLINKFSEPVRYYNDIGLTINKIIYKEESNYVDWKKPVHLNLTFEEFTTIVAIIGGLNEDETNEAINRFEEDDMPKFTPVDGLDLYQKLYSFF